MTRTLLPQIVVLLTASAARAEAPGMTQAEWIQLHCGACMVVLFAVVLLYSVVMLVIDRLNRHKERPPGTKPPRTPPSPLN